MPDLALIPATVDHEATVARLLQLYAYDLSDLAGLDVDADGLFRFPFPDRYWTHARYATFLFQLGSHLAGFAIVDSRSRFSGDPAWDMNQFFVLRRYRRAGVGSRAATTLFGRFPGRWEVREAAQNTPAQSFWRKVIASYTQGHFDEVTHDDPAWHGPVQRFSSSP